MDSTIITAVAAAAGSLVGAAATIVATWITQPTSASLVLPKSGKSFVFSAWIRTLAVEVRAGMGVCVLD